MRRMLMGRPWSGTDPPVSLNPQEGRAALGCHLQGEQWRDKENKQGRLTGH